MPNQIRKLSGQDQSLKYPIQSQLLYFMDAQPFRFVAAFLILGILLAVTTIATHPATMKSGETDSWWAIVLNLLHGHGYSLCLPQYFPFCGPSNQVTAMREPAPVLLFALAAWIGKGSLLSAEIVEALIYLSIILSIYFMTREWAGTRAAVIASFLWTIYRPAFELIPQVSGDLFAALCVSLGILFTLRARKTQKPLDWIMAGIGLGVAVISRSATLVIAGVVIVGQIFEGLRQRGQARTIVKGGLLFASVVILIMAPWWIRNKITLGRTIIGSSLTGYNLYRHNHILEKEHYLRYVGPEEGAQAIQELISRQSDLDSDENEAQFDLVYRGEALKIIKAQPVRYILLSAYRFFPLWFDWKIAEAYGSVTDRYGYEVMVLQAILLVLACVGVRQNVHQTWPLWGSILMISAIYMAVDARLLYTMPVMPLVISLSAAGANELIKKVIKV